ncbi:carboxypeptidase B [Acyrthosiphon pisum]|uniref:Peptidase M14 domain-containing protein n=1 Tax=Acyrthosiphon pisum TaxID=7029 RepID=A0A8R1W743_ACYPI|nr:carboxypeptidase B [Acyrthosiphon pisum]|eukprot:XP_001949019.4 PREDICTED: carboxypeptidase B [Acyrthosiphon pisum]
MKLSPLQWLAVVAVIVVVSVAASPAADTPPAAAASATDTAEDDDDDDGGGGSVFPFRALQLYNTVAGYLEYIFDIVIAPITGGVSNKKQTPSRVSYKKFQIIRVLPSDEDEVLDIEAMSEEPGVQVWMPIRLNKTADLVLPPSVARDVKRFLTQREINFIVLSSDLERSIHKQNPKSPSINQKSELKATKGHVMTWTRYHRYQDILDYLMYLSENYPHLVELLPIGKTVEGRPLKVVKISSGQTRENVVKPAIWIDAGIHAREWISPAVALFILRQLVENKSYRTLISEIDWYILPMINADGYEYSHTVDRLWRKSRRTAATKSGRTLWDVSYGCEGVDLNRNWDWHWAGVGASQDPCSDTFAGSHAFSEPETRAVSDFILDHRDRIQVYLTLHSYSQMWLVPWSHTKKLADDYDDMMYLARQATEAIQKVHGSHYQLGTTPSLLYTTSGCSDDWAKGKAGIKYSYTIELPDKGMYGFLLPAEKIVTTGKEIFTGIKSIAKSILKINSMKEKTKLRG